MTPKAPFTGRVLAGGLLVMDRPKDYAHHVRRLAGQYVEVIVRKQRVKRSLPQNKWHWGVAVPMIAEKCGYDRHEHERMHYELVALCFGTTRGKNGVEIPNKQSSELTTADFSKLMEWEVLWAAIEYDLVIPLPNEVEAA